MLRKEPWHLSRDIVLFECPPILSSEGVPNQWPTTCGVQTSSQQKHRLPSLDLRPQNSLYTHHASCFMLPILSKIYLIMVNTNRFWRISPFLQDKIIETFEQFSSCLERLKWVTMQIAFPKLFLKRSQC